jgi:prephenate dehydrogenase
MKRLLLIGGRGQMGRIFAAVLARHYAVDVLDLDNAAQRDVLLANADVVIVTVPLELTPKIIAALHGKLRTDTLLADFASVKAPAVEAMLQAHAGPVVGLHPMFGPGVKTISGQAIVVCPGREPAAAAELLRAFGTEGARLVECTAAEHDHMMTVVQALRHFVTFSLGSFLAEERVDVTRSLEFASPVYRLEIDMVSRLLAQDARLYVDIMLATPERRAMIQRLAQHYGELAALVGASDRAGLLVKFDAAEARFAQEAERALQESNELIAILAQRLQSPPRN